jgi:hypothetical protein
MNVEIGTEAAQFLFWEISLQCELGEREEWRMREERMKKMNSVALAEMSGRENWSRRQSKRTLEEGQEM